MTITDKVVVAAGVLLAVGAIWYWRTSSPAAAAAGPELQTEQKDLLTAMRRERPVGHAWTSDRSGSGATGWSAA